MRGLDDKTAVGVRRLAAVLAAAATGNDPEQAEALSAQFEEDGFSSSDPNELLMQRWYERGVIIAAGTHRGRLVHTEATVNGEPGDR